MSRGTWFAIFGISAVAAVVSGRMLLPVAQPPMPEPPALAANSDVDSAIVNAVAAQIAEVRRAPHDANARFQLAMIYHANGLPALAQAAYEQAIVLDLRNPKVFYYLALVRAEMGDLSQAITAIDQSIERYVEHSPSYWRRGYWQLDLDQLQEAQSSFEQAINIQPGDAAAQVGLARVEIARKQYVEAAERLLKIIASDNDSTHNRNYIRQLLGTVQHHLGKPSPAMSHLTNAASSLRSPIQWPDEWEAELHERRVGYHATLSAIEQSIASGKHDRAVELAKGVLNDKPNDVAALNWLAIAHLSAKQFEEGMAALHEALTREPHHYATHLNLARALESRGDIAGALQHARQAAEINPGAGQAHLLAGRLLAQHGESASALASLTRAIEAGANDSSVRVLLGKMLLEEKRWAEAVKVFEQTVRFSPDNAEAFAGLAHARAEVGALPQARMALQRASQLNPHLPSLQQTALRLIELEGRTQ